MGHGSNNTSNKTDNENDIFQTDPSVHGFLDRSLHFLAGYLGGCAGILVGHPLDTIKVNLQTQDIKNPKYRGVWHCFQTLLHEESLRGLYRGIGSPMAVVGLVNATVFGVYGNVQHAMKNPNSLKTHLLAGSIAGFVQSFVRAPAELIKTRMQLQLKSKKGLRNRTSWECLKCVVRNHGIRGVYRGLGPTIARDVPGCAAYFVSYEYMMTLPPSPRPVHTFFAGGFAGMLSWAACQPLDVVKTTLQAERLNANPKYTGILDCIRKGYKLDGFRFFFRGFTANLIRAFPTSAACFFVVSLITRLSHSEECEVEDETATTLEKLPVTQIQKVLSSNQIMLLLISGCTVR